MKRRGVYCRSITWLVLGCLVTLAVPQVSWGRETSTLYITKNRLYGSALVTESLETVQELANNGQCMRPQPHEVTKGAGFLVEVIDVPDTYQPVWPWDLTKDSSAGYLTKDGEIIPFYCQPQAFTQNQQGGDSPPLHHANAEDLNSFKRGVIWVIVNLIWVYVQIGIWVLGIAGHFLAFALGASRFITSPIVRTGWPFVQGLANLGFILALLFIAFATTLQLEIGGNWRRLLPRLLLAALLINFSLVIGGILIDASRIMMAVLAQIIGGTSLTNIGYDLLQKVSVVTAVFEIQKGSSIVGVGPITAWAQIFQAAQAAIVVWGLAFGFIVVALMLAMRYIMLLLLLIFSPFAYLAMAVPNAQGWAKKWWSEFIKWTFYGPVALFILILVTQLGGMDVVQGSQTTSDKLTLSLLNIALTVALLVFAATVGRKFSAAGSALVMDFASKRGKQIGGLALGAHKLAGRAAYESRAGALVRKPVRGTSGYYGAWKKSYGDRAKKEEGRGAERYNVSRQERKQRETNVKDAKATVVASPNNAALWDRTKLNATTLRQGYMTEGLDKDDKKKDIVINKITRYTDQSNDVSALINNNDFMKDLAKDQTGALQAQFIANIRLNDTFKTAPGLSATQRDNEIFKIQERLVRDALAGITKAQDKLASGGDEKKK